MNPRTPVALPLWLLLLVIGSLFGCPGSLIRDTDTDGTQDDDDDACCDDDDDTADDDTASGCLQYGLSVDGSANLEPGSSLELYVDGVLDVIWSAQVNVVSGDPSRLTIYMLGTDGMELGTASALYGSIQHPHTTLTISSSELFGTAIGDSLQVIWSSAVHVDNALVCP